MEQQRRFTHAVLSFGLTALLLAGRAASGFQGPQLVRDGYVPIAIPASAAAGEPAAGQSAPTPKVRRTVDELNRYRRIAGISPVVEDSRISVGCRRHAHYLVLNAGRPEVQGLGAHREVRGRPGYTEEGRSAAEASVIIVGSDPVSAVNECLATLFHRIPLLRPNLRRIGLGCEGQVTVIDAIAGLAGEEAYPVAFPAAGQEAVPISMAPEFPSPSGGRGRAGYPITLQFPAFGPEVSVLHARLTGGSGEAVPFLLSSPQHPAAQFPQQNTVALIPSAPLTPGARYHVELEVRCASRAVSRTWSFATAAR